MEEEVEEEEEGRCGCLLALSPNLFLLFSVLLSVWGARIAHRLLLLPAATAALHSNHSHSLFSLSLVFSLSNLTSIHYVVWRRRRRKKKGNECTVLYGRKGKCTKGVGNKQQK